MSGIDMLAYLLSGPVNWPPPTQSEWECIKAQSIEQGVAPLIAHLARPHLSSLEQSWCDAVLKQSWAGFERSLWVLQRVLTLLDGAGVRALALKGPLLALRCYSPPWLRKPSVDLDLAVRQRDLPEAIRVLVNEGFRPSSSIEQAARVSHHVVLEHVEWGTVELHYRLSHGVSGIAVEEIFERAVTCQLPSGYAALVPGPSDEVLHLILHLVQDRFSLLFHFVEVRTIWAVTPLSEREEAVRRGIEHGFAGVFRLADAAFRCRWKEPLLPAATVLPRTWLNWRLTEKLYRSMENSTLDSNAGSLAARIRGRWFDLQTTDTPAEALRAIRAMAWIGWLNFRKPRVVPACPQIQRAG